MSLRVQYLCHPTNPLTECWTFIPMVQGLEASKQLARDGAPDAIAFFGAVSFRIVNAAGKILAEERLDCTPRTHAGGSAAPSSLRFSSGSRRRSNA